MLVQCTGCATTYKISDAKVPPGGVRVKCPKCRVVFTVKKETDKEPETLGEKLFGKDLVRRPFLKERMAREPAGVGVEEKPEREPETPVEKEPECRETSVEEATEAPVAPAATEESPASEAPASRAVAPEDSAAEDSIAEDSTPAPCEIPEKEIAAEDALNLARALISDVLFYNREKRDKGLAEGRVLAYLGNEIARSWELYKDRVGIEKAMGTDYFREAVNEILGEESAIL